MELGNLLRVAKDCLLDVARLWDLLGLDDILVLGDEPLHADHDGALSLVDLVSPPLGRFHLGALNRLVFNSVSDDLSLDADLLHVSPFAEFLCLVSKDSGLDGFFTAAVFSQLGHGAARWGHFLLGLGVDIAPVRAGVSPPDAVTEASAAILAAAPLAFFRRALVSEHSSLGAMAECGAVRVDGVGTQAELAVISDVTDDVVIVVEAERRLLEVLVVDSP